jgi:hypothetical protein
MNDQIAFVANIVTIVAGGSGVIYAVVRFIRRLEIKLKPEK